MSSRAGDLRLALRSELASLIGVAVGLGNVWRFPYMVGKFGGAGFVLIYALAVLAVGVPALMAEWSLGRATRRGPVGAFARAGLPFGRAAGWLFFALVAAATAYYTNVIGWVLYHAAGQLAPLAGAEVDAAAILPPAAGFDRRSLGLQLLCTTAVLASGCAVLARGLRRGIERSSRWLMPALAVVLLLLAGRGLSLPGAGEGLAWYLLKVDLAAITPRVILAALGQAFFSLSLGGTFMVIYGSYLDPGDELASTALWTAGGDLGAGLLAGLAILPAVFAFGLEPASGPGLVFATLPRVFAAMPAGRLFGGLFFLGLAGAAFLSALAAYEVLVAGLTDNTRLGRRRAIALVAGIVLVAALPPMLNLRIFVPWDLTFGSGAQVAGSLLAVLTAGWVLRRAALLEQLGGNPWLLAWLRFVVPGALVAVGAWWLLEEVL